MTHAAHALTLYSLLFLFLYSGPAGGAPVFSPSFASWGIAREAVLGRMIPSGTTVSELSPRANPRYENKILSYLTSINGELADRITIVQASSSPRRDYLFIRNRLMAVMELYGPVKSAAFAETLRSVTNVYGSPHVQHEGTTTTYSFSGEKTLVLVQLSKVGEHYDCTVHYYARSLFKILLTE
ncbi:MAG TPA: hypothetical protein PKO25_04090 [Spirochaetota bacterium]|nr:hypothetical protein [Spirochaetota bacterium]